jgi:hypothetical protein
MIDRKKDVGATQSTEFTVGAATKVVVQIKGYINGHPLNSKMNFGSNTSKSHEIFRIC